MLDENCYPDEKSLKKIAKWDIFTQGVDGLLDLIEENTNWADRQIHRTGKRVIRYEYHTGGWSGNEEVIDALQQNFFWFLFWEKSLRGGHYYFRIEHPERFGKILRQEMPTRGIGCGRAVYPPKEK